jgi:DNA-binding NarL/FixJ family response regulator
MPPGDAIRVVLVDDHVLVREGLREILEAHDDLKVVGEAGDSEGAIAVVTQKRPDVVLLDVEIPGADDVITTVSRLLAAAPATKVIILSMYDGPRLVQNLLDLGVTGYLLKSVTRHELVAAIRGSQADPDRIMVSVSRRSLAVMQGGGEVTLSPQERAILQLVAQALSNAQIASRVSITEATVKRHLHNIFAKLGAVSRIDAVNKAAAASLIVPHGQERTDGPPQRH